MNNSTVCRESILKSYWRGWIVFSVLGGIIFTLILTAPANLVDGNEDRMFGFVQDAVQDGNWICPRDNFEKIPTKPPLFTWLSALATVITGRVNPLTLYFPSFLATVLLVSSVFAAGKKYFNERAGWLAGLVLLFSPGMLNQLAACRHDGLFALGIFLGAMAAFHAWISGRGWIWFWLAGIIATLTKGPLGLVLAAGGLAAFFWEKKSGEPLALKGKQWPGILLFILICGGWFTLAYWKTHGDVVNRMIFGELIGHALTTEDGDSVGSGFYEPTLHFLGNFAPWSLLVFWSLWRILKKPSQAATERRFERFLFCGFFFGLIVFSLAAHQRARLIVPLFPFGALLAGRELACLACVTSSRKFFKIIASLVAVGLLAIGINFHRLERHHKSVVETEGMRQFAKLVQKNNYFPLAIVNCPFPFQYYLKDTRPFTPIDQAVELLKGEPTVFVAISHLEKIKKYLPAQTIYEIARWPITGEPILFILSNYPSKSVEPDARTK